MATDKVKGAGVAAAEAGKKPLQQGRSSLVQYLKTFPVDIDPDDELFARNRKPSSPTF